MFYLNEAPVLCSLNKVAYGLEKLNSRENGLMNDLVVCNRLYSANKIACFSFRP